MNCESKLSLAVGGEIIHLKEMTCLIGAVSGNNTLNNFNSVSKKHSRGIILSFKKFWPFYLSWSVGLSKVSVPLENHKQQVHV